MAIKINLTVFPPFYSAGLRFLLAGVVLYAVMKFRGLEFPRDAAKSSPSLVFGVMNGLCYGCVYWGEQFISSGLTAILMASLPFFSIIMARIFIREAITVRKTTASLVGFAGVLLLFYEGVAGGSGSRVAGELAIVAAAAISALAGVHIKKKSTIDALTAVTIQVFTTGAVLTAVAAVVERVPAIGFSWEALAAFLYLSLVGSALAFYMYNCLIARMEVSRVGYIALITPGIATILGVIWLGEALQWQTTAGLALILAGTAVLNLKQPVTTGRGRLTGEQNAK